MDEIEIEMMVEDWILDAQEEWARYADTHTAPEVEPDDAVWLSGLFSDAPF